MNESEVGQRWMLSSDSHVIEPPDLWTSRVPQRYLDRVFRVERGEDGVDYWTREGVRTSQSFLGPDGAGIRYEAQHGAEALNVHAELNFSEARRGGYIPELHVKDNESDGVWGSVIYPSHGLTVFSLGDPELAMVTARAYNDWAAEFCAAVPDRLKGVAVVPLHEVGSGLAEMERARSMGLVAAAIPISQTLDVPYDDTEFEPLWAAAEDLDMVLSFHIATNRVVEQLSYIRTRIGQSMVDQYVRDTIARMIFSGVFERHRTLRLVSVEQDAGWAAWFLQRMDFVYAEKRHVDPGGPIRLGEGMLPSDYWARNCFVSFQEDAVAVNERTRIGVDNLLWGSDYPHMESTFPRSREQLDKFLVGTSDQDRQKIVCDNSARVFGFEVPDHSAAMVS